MDKAEAMKLARAIAKEGGCTSWGDVLRVLRGRNEDAAFALKLRGIARDFDEIERLCERSRRGVGVTRRR